MGLSAEEKIIFHEIVGIPYTSGEFYVTDNMGTGKQQLTETLAAASAKTDINNFLEDTDKFTSNMETRMRSLIQRWEAIGTNIVSVQGGGAGGISGVSFDLQQEREIIRRRVQNMVPWLRWEHYLEKARGGGSASIPMVGF